ncbi:MAG: glycosyltransferase family 39 protein [Candidatus Omnitrophota bacterium]
MPDKKGITQNVAIMLGACLLLGFVLRMQSLSSRSLWTDEFFTLFLSTGHGDEVSRLIAANGTQGITAYRAGALKQFLRNDASKGIRDVLRGVLATDTHPPLYYGIMHYWLKVFGDSAVPARMFSVCVGLIAVLLAYGVGLYLFDRHAAIFSALVISCISIAVRFSQEARSYSLVIALGLLSWLLLLRFERNKRTGDIIGFLVVNALGMYSHYFYLFISLGQFLYFSFRYRNIVSLLQRYYLAFLASWALYAPWAAEVLHKGYNFRLVEWAFGYPGIKDKLFEVLRGPGRYFFLSDTYPALLFVLGALCFFMLGAFWRGRKKSPAYSAAVAFCLCITAVPLLAICGIDLLQQGALLKQVRFWVFPFIGCIPVLGYCMSRLYRKNKVVSFAVIFLLVAATHAAGSMQFGPAPLYASQYMHARSQGSIRGVIVFDIRSVVFAQSFYLDDGTYVVPVSNLAQLYQAVSFLSSHHARRIFIVRHYHPTGASLMSSPFMEKDLHFKGYTRVSSMRRDYTALTEYAQ